MDRKREVENPEEMEIPKLENKQLGAQKQKGKRGRPKKIIEGRVEEEIKKQMRKREEKLKMKLH
jgi:hypothetical protein